jgi:hypothetical protein
MIPRSLLRGGFIPVADIRNLSGISEKIKGTRKLPALGMPGDSVWEKLFYW